MIPEDCKYAETHEWIRIEGTLAAVGITDYAQEALGDITFVELPLTGMVVEQGQECSVVESVKAVSDIYAPISGEVVEINHSLEDSPEKINEDPYGSGWIFKLKDYNKNELGDLMDAGAYEEFLESEE